jgi:hypothetical protein
MTIARLGQGVKRTFSGIALTAAISQDPAAGQASAATSTIKDR